MLRKPEENASYRGIKSLAASLRQEKKKEPRACAPLSMPGGIMPNPEQDVRCGRRWIEAYLGVDVGSVSTNVVVIDRQMRVLSKRYLPTAGRPIEAVKQGLAEVGEEVGRGSGFWAQGPRARAGT